MNSDVQNVNRGAEPHAIVLVRMPDGTPFHVLLAVTPVQREQGLMGSELPPDTGMLFVFDFAGCHPMWMKGCYTALDILWLDGTGRIVWVVNNAPPCQSDPCPTYPGGIESRYVLEIAAGQAARHGALMGASIGL